MLTQRVLYSPASGVNAATAKLEVRRSKINVNSMEKEFICFIKSILFFILG